MGSVTPKSALEEYPQKVSLAHDVYRPFPPLPAAATAAALPLSPSDAKALVAGGLDALAGALQAGDEAAVGRCFLRRQAYWRDILALTWHLRTLRDAPAIAPALATLAGRRGFAGQFELDAASVREVTIGPALRWVEGLFSFETGTPAARCGGRVVLVPEEEEEGDGGIAWRIWVLSTWVDELKAFPEDVAGLKAPGRNLDGPEEEVIETDALILGGGNAGLILSARLKAIGAESIVVDRNARSGDNWALRYDCLRFHIGRHNCETPYLNYPDHLPVILSRDDLADHMRNYAATFHLNILYSSTIEGCSFSTARGAWTVRVRTPTGPRVVRAKHLVQSTGLGGSEPYMPSLPGAEAYKGVNLHSVAYKNPKTLSDKGAKSVIIVGSANSAFDVMEDCANADLATTMVARSPTYLFPWDYALAPEGLGAYETLGAPLADKLQMSGPAAVGGQLARGLQGALADREPHRYEKLAAAGFPVYDSREGRGDLMHHLFERAGGHFNDIGEGVRMIEEGRVKVVGNVEPVAYGEKGLQFSDGRTVEADAIVWCTGFRDKDRDVTTQVLGGKKFVLEGEDGGEGEVLGPQDIAARRDAIWGVDEEGELRGVFKRHLKVDNYWIFGGTTAMHRYYSWPIALQIKAAVAGILPEAYRE